jgi:hypothetical protein
MRYERRERERERKRERERENSSEYKHILTFLATEWNDLGFVFLSILKDE